MYTNLIVLSFVLILYLYSIIIFATYSKTSIELNIIDEDRSEPSSRTPKKQNYHVPKFMLELYESNKNSKFGPEIVKSLIPRSGLLGEEIEETDHLLVFDIPETDPEEDFVQAELKILTVFDHCDFRTLEKKLILSIFDQEVGKFLKFRELEDKHINNSWLSFDVTKPILTILKQENKSLKVIVTAIERKKQKKLKMKILPETEDLEHDYPILLLSYSSKSNDSSKRRVRRGIEDDYEEETNNVWNNANEKKLKKRNGCRRKPLYVDFSEIEYDIWIVQPSGYEAYQCQGRCFYPVANHLNPTKHAVVQALLHSVSPGKASRSCCVPIDLDPISILYIDESGVLTYRYAYKDMVVKSCGCR